MEHKHISKGIYQHSQIGNFISVKNYIFIRKEEKKLLMLRFSNDFDYVVDSMTYFVLQLDHAGKILARTKITNGDLEFRPGSMYVTEQPICVDEYCSDFKVVFSEVTSGSYRYEVHSDMIAVHYIKAPEPIIDLSGLSKGEARRREDDSVEEYYAEQKTYQERGVAAFIGAIVTVLLLGANILGMFLGYFFSRNPEKIGEFRYFGPLLEKSYDTLTAVSLKLNALSDAETVILMIAAFFCLFFASLAVSCVEKRKALKKKRNFYERMADEAKK